MSRRPSRRRSRRCSLCFSDSSSSSLTSSAELGIRPLLAAPDDDPDEEAGSAASPPAAGRQPPRGGASSGCLALLRHRCLSSRGQGRDGLVAVGRTEKLEAQWALEDQVASHLRRLESQPITSFHVAQTGIHIAAVSWLGGWRPSAILSAVPHLHGGGPLELSRRRRQILDEAVRRFKVEEAVLDEEAAEVCSMGLLSLLGGAGGGGAAAEGMRKVAERARQLRLGALEFAVRRVMDAGQAADFLFRLEGFQQALQRMAAVWSSGVGDLRLSLQQSTSRLDH